MSHLNLLILLTAQTAKFLAPRSRDCPRATWPRLRNLMDSSVTSRPAIPGIGLWKLELRKLEKCCNRAVRSGKHVQKQKSNVIALLMCKMHHVNA
jgi:hypothetical protein